jgi:hypothetical protein
MKKFNLIGEPVIWRGSDGKTYHLGNEKLHKRGLPDKIFAEVVKTGRIEEKEVIKDGK